MFVIPRYTRVAMLSALPALLLLGCGEKSVSYPGSLTALVLSANAATQGTNIIFSATVNPAVPNGAVNFRDGTTVLGSGALLAGQATFSTSSLAVGDHSITAEFDGTSTEGPSTSAPVALSITAVPQAATAVTLTASTPFLIVGSPISLTAAVSSLGTGKVNFYDSSALVGSALPLDAAGTVTLYGSIFSPGRRTFTATYSGALGFAPSTSNPVDVDVSAGPPIPTTLRVSISPSNTQNGQTATLTITLVPANAQGTLDLIEDGITLSTGGRSENPLIHPADRTEVFSAYTFRRFSAGTGDLGGTYTDVFPTGTHHFYAVFSGTVPYQSSTSNVATLTVTP